MLTDETTRQRSAPAVKNISGNCSGRTRRVRRRPKRIGWTRSFRRGLQKRREKHHEPNPRGRYSSAF